MFISVYSDKEGLVKFNQIWKKVQERNLVLLSGVFVATASALEHMSSYVCGVQ